MQFSDDQVKNALETKERLGAEIQKHKEQIEMLEKNLALIDSILKQQSFTKASALNKMQQVIPLRKNTDGVLIANAYVTPDEVSIVLEDGIELKEDIHPFKSFFLERIIGDMKRKDMADLEKGALDQESVINCLINKNGSLLRQIIIKNYRQKERVNEIINTATWSFSKMIENSK